MPCVRDHRYIWTTWISRLLAGESHCEWASWFRAHYQDWLKPPSDFDQTQWMMNHTDLVSQARESRETLGYTVYTEGQNSFRLRGSTATLAGKPDLIAVRNGDAVIINAKTGRPSPHHSVQVLIYMYAVPRALPEYHGMEFRGHLIYPESHVQIPVSGLDQPFVERLGALIRRLADETPARRVPSAQECRWCDITAADCPERVEDEAWEEGVTADF